MLSLRALGALGAMIGNPVLTSAEKLSEAFLEGEKAIRTALKELEDVGFIKRGKYRVNGRILSYTDVTEAGQKYYFSTLPSAGFDRAVTGCLCKGGKQYSSYNSNSSTLISNKRFSDGVRGEKKIMEISMSPYEFFDRTSSDDEAVQEKAKWQKERQTAYEQAKAAAQAKRLRKDDTPKSSWSCKDVAEVFADKVSFLWHIKPWSLTRSRFVPALSGMRKRLGTDGEIECLMVDLFFKSVQHDKYDNADALWKLFITRAPELLQQARGTVTSEEDLVAAKQQADRSWEWMEDEQINV